MTLMMLIIKWWWHDVNIYLNYDTSIIQLYDDDDDNSDN